MALLPLPQTISVLSAGAPDADAVKVILLVVCLLLMIGWGTFCAIRPSALAAWNLRWYTDDRASPSERSIRLIRRGGIVVAASGLCLAVFFFILLTR